MFPVYSLLDVFASELHNSAISVGYDADTVLFTAWVELLT
jgi:hypothetical protein